MPTLGAQLQAAGPASLTLTTGHNAGKNPHRLIRRPGVTSVPDGNNWMRRGRVNKIFHKRKNGLVKLRGQRMGRLEEIRRGLRAFQVGVQGKLRENAKWKGYSRK